MKPVFNGLVTRGRQRRQIGVSMIEVLIVVVVLAVLAAAGVPAFQEWIANARIRATSDNILNGLQLARAEAIKRNRYVDFRLDAEPGADPAGDLCRGGVGGVVVATLF